MARRRREDLDTDTMLRFALLRAIEVMGEAASRVSQDTRSQTPSVPWSDIVSMRNRLVHAYFDIDPEVVWKTATEEIPAVLPMLLPLLDEPS
ncbi:MAG: HepT-like ribonuclease domain-containing protein [Caulobacteraceae bacterium]